MLAIRKPNVYLCKLLSFDLQGVGCAKQTISTISRATATETAIHDTQKLTDINQHC